MFGHYDADDFPGGELFDFDHDGDLDAGEYANYTHVVYGGGDTGSSYEEDDD